MAGGAEIQVVADPAGEVAALLAQAAGRGEQIALTGGSSPKLAYEQSAAADVDWSQAGLWFGDERCVEPDDKNSNYGMAKAALLDRISGSAPQVHRMQGELGPHDGAGAYERDLHDVFGAGMPELDLVLLGLGPDGHCASLFPHQATLEEQDRLAVGVDTAGMEPRVPRITLTLPMINAARRVVFLVTGAEKADAVARAWEGDPDPGTPASLVAPASGELLVLLDAPAAAQLRQGPE